MPFRETYVIEQYAPPFPETSGYVRIHQGDFESNRDSLSPSMISYKEVNVPARARAIMIAKEWVQELNNKVKKKRIYKYNDT